MPAKSEFTVLAVRSPPQIAAIKTATGHDNTSGDACHPSETTCQGWWRPVPGRLTQSMSRQDLGDLVAHTALADGTPVYDRQGKRIGVVEHVMEVGGIFGGNRSHPPIPRATSLCGRGSDRRDPRARSRPRSPQTGVARPGAGVVAAASGAASGGGQPARGTVAAGMGPAHRPAGAPVARPAGQPAAGYRISSGWGSSGGGNASSSLSRSSSLSSRSSAARFWRTWTTVPASGIAQTPS